MSLKAIRSETYATGNATHVDPHSASKVRTTFHQLVRDWSEEGAEERDESYGRIRRELARVLPVTSSNINKQVRLLYSVYRVCTIVLCYMRNIRCWWCQ